MAKRKKQTKLQRQIKAQEWRIQKIIKEIEEVGFDVKYKLPKLGQRPSTAYLKRLKGVKKVAVSKASFAPTGESYRQWVLAVATLKREQTRREKKEDAKQGYTPKPRPAKYSYTDYDEEEASEEETLDDIYQTRYDNIINEIERAIQASVDNSYHSIANKMRGLIDTYLSNVGFSEGMKHITENWDEFHFYFYSSLWYVDPVTGERVTQNYIEAESYYTTLINFLLG